MELTPVPDKFLPALPAFITEALPSFDQKHLGEFDVQLSQLIGAARDKGFSETTVDSIFAARQRLYAERAFIWKHLKFYDVPLAGVERMEDETEARSWVKHPHYGDHFYQCGR